MRRLAAVIDGFSTEYLIARRLEIGGAINGRSLSRFEFTADAFLLSTRPPRFQAISCRHFRDDFGPSRP